VDQLRVILVTAPSNEVASTLARAAIEAKLAACVNVLPGLRSIYRWEGKIEESSEVLLIIKSAPQHLRALEELLSATHPYTVSEFVVLSPEEVSQSYLNWALAEMRD